MNPINPPTHRERGSSRIMRAVRGIRDRAKRRRSGLSVFIQVLLYAALAAAIVLGALNGPDLYRRVVGGAEHNTLKGNIDRVAQVMEEYWGQYATDRDGRRKIDLVEACNFVNSQLAQGDTIVLRTMAAVNPGTLSSTTANEADRLSSGAAVGMARLPTTGSEATCPTATTASSASGEIADAVSHDIVVSGTGTLAAGTTSHIVAAAGTAADTVSLEDLALAGLASTRGVWMMQPVGLSNTAVAPTSASCSDPAHTTQSACTGAGETWSPATPGVAADLPQGTAVSATHDNEVLIIGGVAPDGTSFCLVKVFDADDRAAIGDYRAARQAGEGTDNPFVTCTSGIDGTGPNQVRLNAGWPEPR